VRLTSGSTSVEEERSIRQARNFLSGIPGLRYEINKPTLFSFSTPIEIEIRGFNLTELKRVSDRITQQMNESGRFADVSNSMELGSPEIQIIFDRDKAASYGLQVNEVADRVVNLVRGEVATQYSYQDRKIDVLVRSEENDRLSAEDIGALFVNPESDRPIPLSAIATLQSSVGPSEIRRSSQQRVAVVSANIQQGDLSLAAQEVNDILRATPMPTGIYAELAGQNEELASSFQSLMFALALAIFLVYLVMASQFESLLHPFIILFTIPLALVGAVLALYITGSTLSVVVFIGGILLAGIVVNNAIVLIDLINQLRYEGLEKYEAITQGAQSRLRPILMTTLTTTLGLLPLALGFGDGAELRAPMGITVIGGLLFSTLLTLVVIPVMYALLDRKSYKKVEI
jgi:HAE1 family hydrophobic/amphiphilic exporter-1